jgi:hypothetical protein
MPIEFTSYYAISKRVHFSVSVNCDSPFHRVINLKCRRKPEWRRRKKITRFKICEELVWKLDDPSKPVKR